MDFNQAIQLQTSSSTFINLNSVSSAVAPATPVSGYAVESAGLGQSTIRGYVTENAQRDGVQAAEAFFGPRAVEISVAVFGSTLGDFWDKIDALNGALDPYPAQFESDDGFRQLRFYSPTGATSRHLYMFVRPSNLPSYSFNKNQSVGPSSKGFAANARVSFTAKDPRKISVSETTVSISTGTTTIAYNGTYDYYPRLIVTASGTSASYTLGSRTIGLSGLSSGTSYYIDHQTYTIRTGSFTGTLVPARIDNTTTTGFGPIRPGGNIVLSGSVSDCSLIYREAWL
jgi:hypothetical protein